MSMSMSWIFFFFFFFNDTATTEIYTLSLHDALPILGKLAGRLGASYCCDRMSGFSRRIFLHASGLAFLALAVRRLAALGAPRPCDEVPWKVQQVLKQLFGDRPVQNGHVQLDVPTVAADGRVLPVVGEADLRMAADRYVKAVHLLVDNNPDIHRAALRL